MKIRYPVYVTFEVYRVWKGDIGKKVSIHTAMSGASCGFDFNKNQDYLVYSVSPLKSPIDDKNSLSSQMANLIYYVLGGLIFAFLLYIILKKKKS
jgi:hypothetical protein